MFGTFLGILISILRIIKSMILIVLTLCGFYLGIYLEAIGFFDKMN